MVICLKRGVYCLHMVQLTPLHPQTHHLLSHLNPDWFYLSATGWLLERRYSGRYADELTSCRPCLPGAIPAVRFDDVARLLRLIPVAEHYVVSADTQLSLHASLYHFAALVHYLRLHEIHTQEQPKHIRLCPLAVQCCPWCVSPSSRALRCIRGYTAFHSHLALSFHRARSPLSSPKHPKTSRHTNCRRWNGATS